MQFVATKPCMKLFTFSLSTVWIQYVSDWKYAKIIFCLLCKQSKSNYDQNKELLTPLCEIGVWEDYIIRDFSKELLNEMMTSFPFKYYNLVFKTPIGHKDYKEDTEWILHFL